MPPVGCRLELPLPRAEAEVSFARDVAPILNAHCVTCHRPGGGGPFALTSAAEAAATAAIADMACGSVVPASDFSLSAAYCAASRSRDFTSVAVAR